MLRVLIRAPLLSVSGYGVHSRQIFSYLENSESNFDILAQVVPWGNTPWMVNPDLESGMIGRIMSKSFKDDKVPDLSLQVQLPNEWDPNIARVNVGVTAVVETDICNPDWILACNRMDAVIVPSEHAKSCLEASGRLEVDVHVIPEWFFKEIEKDNLDNSVDELDNLETSFNFLIVSQLTGQTPETDRKNILFTIKWLCETFKNDEDVGIILKTNHGRGTKIDRKLTEGLVRKVVSEVREGPDPRVHLLHGNLTSEEISSLYRHEKVRGLISLTRGEGFGLPLLEAAASDLPVIATGWSAHKEFLSIGRFIEIGYDLVNVPDQKIDNQIFVSGSKWANPREQDFKKKISKFREKNSIPREWARDLGEKIRERYSSSSISSQYENVIGDILEKCL